MAVGKIILAYRKEFTDYRKTQVKVNFKFDPSLLGEGETTDKQEGEDEK